MIQVLLILVVYIVGPIAILVWAIKRYKHGRHAVYEIGIALAAGSRTNIQLQNQGKTGEQLK